MSKTDQAQLRREQEQANIQQHEDPAQVQAQAAPQQVQAAPQQAQQQELPAQFVQPGPIQAAPAQEQAAPVQQRQLGRKERRAQARQERRQREARVREQVRQVREQARQLAAAKLTMDQMVKTMRENPAPGLPSYESVRPLDQYADRGAYLERVVLSQLQDEDLSRYLLGEIRQYEKLARLDLDQQQNDFEFRQRCIPLYYQEVLHQEVPPAVTHQLARERQDFQVGEQARAERIYRNIRWQIFQHLDQTQQTRAEDRSMLSGIQKEDYEQDIARRMRKDGITRDEARNQRTEEILRARRPVTLRRLEEMRAEHWNSQESQRMEKEAYHTLRYANQKIRREYQGTPALSWEQADFLVRGYLREATQNMSYQMRVPNCAIMGLILKGGRFKTQMETKTSAGEMVIDQRKEFTKKCFGVDPDTLPPEQYEIYGYASHGDLVKESRPDSDVGQGVGQYGQIVVKLKKSAMKGRVTMTLGDSLDANFTARTNFVDRPDLHAVSHKAREGAITDAYRHWMRRDQGNPDPVDLERVLNNAQVGYMELQYHNGVRVEDIESVTLMADYESKDEGVQPEREMAPELVAQLKSLGIRATIVKDGEEHEL